MINNDSTPNSKTRERLAQAAALAKEALGETTVNQNSSMVSSILMSMALDDLGDLIKQETERLTDCIFRSAGHIADSH